MIAKKVKIEKLEEIDLPEELIFDKKSKITLYRLLLYFIIYSILGFFIETAFGLAKYGMLESRKSFLYGPFCAIYGVGAFIMIPSLTYFKKNHISLFVGGCIVGSIIEYLVSLIGELILKVKWWDYSELPLNINGRICLLYSVFWGVLGLVLMISINPRIDKIIDFFKAKISNNALKIIILVTIFFMFVDCIITGLALNYFTIRTIKEKGIEVKNQEYIDNEYEKINKNEVLSNLINKFFNNKKMLITFPRITLQDINGNIINISDLYPEIKTYYYNLNAQ